jgi:tRNA modification GTPase
VSGDGSLQAAKSIIDKRHLDPESHKSYLVTILDGTGGKIDQVLLTYFKKGRSFTGDETVELSCHGNPLLVNAVTQRFLEQGCRAAEPGEFSFRAFYNGKIDLVQAESIQNLVTAKLLKGSQTFLEQLTGRLSDLFNQLQESLVTAMAHLEASIDFVEEDIETADYGVVQKLLNQTLCKTSKLISSYDIGKNLHGDRKILILGNTNAGKSSLFNMCLGVDRAIVTDIAGTTRDLVSGQKFLRNQSVEFLDSAGLRETSDLVETLGIQRGLDQVQGADLILYVVDLDDPGRQDILRSLPAHKVLVVFNKFDLVGGMDHASKLIRQVLKVNGVDFNERQTCLVSTATGFGLEELMEKAEQLLSHGEGNERSEAMITQARHFNHLVRLKTHLESAQELCQKEESPDLVSQELALGLSEVHQLLGKEYDDEVLDKIFSEFCIGK